MFLLAGDSLKGPETGLQARPVLTRMLGLRLLPSLSFGKDALCCCSHLPFPAPSPHSPLSSEPHGDLYRPQRWYPPLCPLSCWLSEWDPRGSLGEGGKKGGRKEGRSSVNALSPCPQVPAQVGQCLHCTLPASAFSNTPSPRPFRPRGISAAQGWGMLHRVLWGPYTMHWPLDSILQIAHLVSVSCLALPQPEPLTQCPPP